MHTHRSVFVDPFTEADLDKRREIINDLDKVNVNHDSGFYPISVNDYVKSEYTDRYGSYRDFRYIKRGMMQLYGIYVNKCIVISNKNNKSLLAATFTPTKYLFRPKRRGDSFLKVKVKKVTTIKEFIQNYGNKKNRK